jgi:predicted transcriptional regulator
MPRAKKEAENFSCKIAVEIYKKLEEYCQVTGLSKTAVVEKAVERYVDENLKIMKEIAEGK